MLFKKKTPLLFFLYIIACKKELPPQKINSFYQKSIVPDDRKTITPEEAKTYHVDKHRQYEYRTGNPGHYEYNYDVKGINLKGDSVFGNISTNGKYGAGILFYDTIDDIEIKTEWV